MKKALITGITGQDGSYLAELLLAKGYEGTASFVALKVYTGALISLQRSHINGFAFPAYAISRFTIHKIALRSHPTRFTIWPRRVT